MINFTYCNFFFLKIHAITRTMKTNRVDRKHIHNKDSVEYNNVHKHDPGKK